MNLDTLCFKATVSECSAPVVNRKSKFCYNLPVGADCSQTADRPSPVNIVEHLARKKSPIFCQEVVEPKNRA